MCGESMPYLHNFNDVCATQCFCGSFYSMAEFGITVDNQQFYTSQDPTTSALYSIVFLGK